METPMTVTGSLEDLRNLKTALVTTSVICAQYEAILTGASLVRWLNVVDQQIKDQEFEQSINPLPFK